MVGKDITKFVGCDRSMFFNNYALNNVNQQLFIYVYSLNISIPKSTHLTLNLDNH